MILLFTFISFSYLGLGQSINTPKQDSILDFISTQIGVPYKWGAQSPNKYFDCSGFTSYIFKKVGINIPRTSRACANTGELINIDNAKVGDLILFSGTQKGSTTIGHIGIITSKTDEFITFAHCSSSKKHFGVTQTVLETSGYLQRFLQIRRVI